MSNVASLPPEQPTDESKLNGASDQPNPSKPSSSPVLTRHSASPSGMQLDDQPTAGTGQQVVQADPLEHNKRVVHVPIDTTSSSLTSAMIFARFLLLTQRACNRVGTGESARDRTCQSDLGGESEQCILVGMNCRSDA